MTRPPVPAAGLNAVGLNTAGLSAAGLNAAGLNTVTISGSHVRALLGATKTAIDNRLAALFTQQLGELQGHDRVLVSVCEALRDLSLRGGKRLRAWLVVVGEQASGGLSREAALEAGVALELLQSYFLIHDDWMDQDSLRRGGPTAHVALATEFHSREKGAIGAILAGDYAVALATEVLAKLEIPSARLGPVVACFGRMQRDAVLGQELDVLADNPDPELVCRLKTSSYTVLGPLKLGALLGGADTSTLEVLERFAEPVGLGFQWRDDLLGAFGDPKETGKPFGNDLVAGKPTLLSQLAFKLAPAEERRTLERVFGRPSAEPSEVDQALRAVERTGARAEVESRISELARAASELVHSSSIDALAKTMLLESVNLLLGRNA